MDKLLSFLRSRAGSAVLALALVTALFFIGRAAWRLYTGDTNDDAHYSMFIDAENNRPFRHRNAQGETAPILSPYTKKPTGYPAEACYWNADGSSKKSPTWVLLNSLAGRQGPTFCPDCGRLVLPRNPAPGEVQHPPPTRDEYPRR